MTTQSIKKQLMKLKTSTRAKLASDLLASLEDLSEEENEKLWLEESLRRHYEIEDGKTKLTPADVVLKNARARLR